jgi:hypothetical protein
MNAVYKQMNKSNMTELYKQMNKSNMTEVYKQMNKSNIYLILGNFLSCLEIYIYICECVS